MNVADLLKASVSESDNTAVDALLKLIGGGKVVTDYLREKGVQGMRVDIDERTMAHVFEDLGKGEDEPRDETAAARHDRLLRGYRHALDLKENTTTLDGAVDFLRKLHDGQLLTPQSTQYLTHLMAMQVIPNRLRAGIPNGYVIMDKTGTGSTVDGRVAAWNDMAIITSPSGKTAVVGAFLRDTTASPEQRDAWFKRIGAAVSTQLK